MPGFQRPQCPADNPPSLLGQALRPGRGTSVPPRETHALTELENAAECPPNATKCCENATIRSRASLCRRSCDFFWNHILACKSYHVAQKGGKTSANVSKLDVDARRTWGRERRTPGSSAPP